MKVLLRAGDVLADHVAAARNGRALAQDHGADTVADLAALAGNAGNAEPDQGAESDEDPFADIGFAPLQVDIDDPPSEVPQCGWRIVFRPSGRLYAKANEPFLIVRELAGLGPVEVEADLSGLPSLREFDPAESYIGWTIILNADVPRESVEEAFEFVADDCVLEIEPLRKPTPAPAIDLPLPVLEKPQAASAPAPAEAADKSPVRKRMSPAAVEAPA